MKRRNHAHADDMRPATTRAAFVAGQTDGLGLFAQDVAGAAPTPPAEPAPVNPVGEADAGSRAGAERIAPSRASHMARVVALVTAYPGRTSVELCARQPVPVGREAAGAMDLTEFRRRLTDAKDANLIHVGPKRLCSTSALVVVTWWPGGPTVDATE